MVNEINHQYKPFESIELDHRIKEFDTIAKRIKSELTAVESLKIGLIR